MIAVPVRLRRDGLDVICGQQLPHNACAVRNSTIADAFIIVDHMQTQLSQTIFFAIFLYLYNFVKRDVGYKNSEANKCVPKDRSKIGWFVLF